MHLNLEKDKHFAFLLKLAISCCFASAAFQFDQFSNSTFSWFYVELSYSESFCEAAVWMGITLLLISSIAVWFKKLCVLTQFGCGVLLLEVVAYMNHASDDYAYQYLLSNSLKVFLPLALLAWQFGFSQSAIFLCRWLVALTFVGHGLRALFDYPLYLDYLIHFFSLIHLELLSSTVLMLLHAIGTIDLALSHHLCFYKLMRIKWVLIYMMAWGLITALARVLFSGSGAWHEVSIRAPHFLVPLALYFLLKQQKTPIVNENERE
jgi:hypothetical protein